MREILFKAKRRDNHEWIVGYYCKYGDNHCIIEPTEFVIAKGVGIIPETLCQFTGLRDKNGKRIFEGNIIRKGFECFVVKWNSNQCRWGLFDKHNFEVVGFNEHTKNYLEVIGNRFDNAELLTAERIGANEDIK